MSTKASNNLSKSQKKALKLIPKGWLNENELAALGVDRSSMLALQAKGFLEFCLDESGKKTFSRSILG